MTSIILLTLTLCLLVGFSLGLLGGGGTVLTVPVFVYVAGMQAGQAIALSLLLIGIVSLIGAVSYWKKNVVNRRLVVFFILSGMPTALAGAKVTTQVSAPYLLLLFGSLMVVIALILLARATQPTLSESAPICRPSAAVSIGIGTAIGFLTGFLGVGGGFLIVPAVSILMRCSIATAIGTSLAIIAVNSLVGFAGHLHHFQFRTGFYTGILIAMVIGVLIGSRISGKLPGNTLQRAFALLILCVGGFVVFKNISILF